MVGKERLELSWVYNSLASKASTATNYVTRPIGYCYFGGPPGNRNLQAESSAVGFNPAEAFVAQILLVGQVGIEPTKNGLRDRRTHQRMHLA